MSTPKRPCLKSLENQGCATNWSNCCLCQQKKSESLTCPALNPIKSSVGVGYRTLAENLAEFSRYGELPQDLKMLLIFGKSNLFDFLMKNKARWHKSCALKYDRFHLERAKKRKRAISLPSEAEVPPLPSPSNEINMKKPRLGRRESLEAQSKVEKCFICDERGPKKSILYSIASLQDAKLKKCADIRNDVELKAFLQGGDLVAKEAKYHSKCYVNLTNCLRTPVRTKDNGTALCHSLAFASVAAHIRENLEQKKLSIFKLTDLRTMYTKNLNNIIGLANSELSEVHSSRLRERILEHFPELRAQLSGREYVFYRQGDNVFKNITTDNLDDDVVAYERVLKKIRQDISQSHVKFEGNLKDSAHGVPSSLLAAINFLLYGHSSFNTDNKSMQPALNICQLITFNYSETLPKGSTIRHKKEREPPLPVYIGLLLYGKTRNQSVVGNFHDRGLCISSDRIREITAALSRVEVQRARQEGILCPAKFNFDQFLVGAYDNIDHNFSSTTSESSFHGTAISIFQLPSVGEVGRPRSNNILPSTFSDSERKVPELPESYSTIKTITLRSKQPSTSKANENIVQLMAMDRKPAWKREEAWLNRVQLDSDISYESLDVSWAAFHASISNLNSTCIEPARGSLLPLFNQSSSSPAMIKHGMELVQKITAFLNPAQLPVLCFDQPLFALAKSIQWNWPETLGESKFLVMFAPFHVEQAFLKVLGQLLSGSGWTSIVANSGIKTEAGADSCLKVTHVTKARAIHEKTAAALYSLLKDAFSYDAPQISFEEWTEKKSALFPTFKFWLLILNLEILLLSFVRSLRSGDYDLFLITLKDLIPWFFLTDHTHYARWLPVHLKDLFELEKNGPEVYKKFRNGEFVIRKDRNPFSALAIDQAHEQNNAVIKGSGGAIGLLHDHAMLRRWMLSGPQLMNILEEFEINTPNSKRLHHEQYPSFQKKFHEKTTVLKESFNQFGNPFLVNSADLLVWDSKIVMGQDRVETLKNAETTADRLYEEFIRDRLGPTAKKSVFDAIPKTGFKIFSFNKKKRVPAVISDLKSDVQLFSRAFIVSQNRALDLEKFFEFENVNSPPALSVNGGLRPCAKAKLLKILEESAKQPAFEELSDAIVYDGAALIHAIPPASSKTFEEYCKHEFKRRIMNDIERYQPKRVHVCWDTYSEESLKEFLREKRGAGVRRKVAQENFLPKNWQDFLACNENKEEIFRLLGKYALENFPSVIITTEIDGLIISSHPAETSIQGTQCRPEEEADSRIFLHAKDCALFGSKKVIISTVDTDVVVLAISYAHSLREKGLNEIWMLFGNGKQQRYININVIAQSVGSEKAAALRGFHSFTGCDVTSSFSTKSKISAWRTWNNFPEATSAFEEISHPRPLSSECFNILEKFTGLLYYKDAADLPINQLRKFLFTCKNRTLQNLPPTKEALRQHCLRALYQAGQVWGRVFSPTEKIPGPEGYGWLRTRGKWSPRWSSQPSIWDACRELVKCNCTAGCRSRCSCIKAQVPCTLLCARCPRGTEIRCGNEFNERFEPENAAEDECLQETLYSAYVNEEN